MSAEVTSQAGETRRILVVDDEPSMLAVCRGALRRLPQVELSLERDSERAARRLVSERFDLLITDLKMPRRSGIDLLKIGLRRHPDLGVLIMTAYPSVDSAVECMRGGALDYAAKSTFPEGLVTAASNLLAVREARARRGRTPTELGEGGSDEGMVGSHHAMRMVFDTIRRVATTDVDVLILGETGTGKELVARRIHRQSDRRGGRFVPVDCGAIPEGLLESELFGFERGAFTGAEGRRKGLLEHAHGGTFFLDEVADMSPRLQQKLLRALQERRIRHLGSREEVLVDVRVIAATSRNLDEEMAAERFRRDLYYRINVGRVDLPPLRERGDDVVLLARHFLARYASEMRRDVSELDEETLAILRRYPWPGNVRELQNIVKRSVLMKRQAGPLRACDLPDSVAAVALAQPAPETPGFFEVRDRRARMFERESLETFLTESKGDVPEAAARAGMPRESFYRLLRRHRLKAADFREP